MRELFEQFVRERRYLKAVSPRTEGWYWQSWKAYAPALEGRTPGEITKGDLLNRIEEMRNGGAQPITINSYSRAVNAFFGWLLESEHTKVLVRIPRLKEAEKVLTTLNADQIGRLIRCRPEGLNGKRAWAVAVVALDTGLRLDEILSLRREDLDLDNLLITVRNGKGGKGRVVPMSIELRKILYRYTQRHNCGTGLVFFAGRGVKVLQNNIRRDLGALMRRAGITGIKGGFHILRHTFAVMRAGTSSICSASLATEPWR